MFKKKPTILYVFVVPVLIFGFAAILPGCNGDKPGPRTKAELEIWGAFDDSDVFEPLISEFKGLYPNVTIKYSKKTFQNYERDLLETMAEGGGPDIFMIHHTWLPRYLNKILPAPDDLITFKDVKDEFVDIVVNDFVQEGSVYGLPLSVDTLALFYNKDIFNNNGIPQPPTDWEEFLENVERVTVKGVGDEITLSGAALGTAYNVNRSTDILSLLMIQSGVQMSDLERKEATFNEPVTLDGQKYYLGERSLLFYTNFAKPLEPIYTWNSQMDYSVEAFYKGDTAMMLNYSYQIPTIRAAAPYLNFDVAPMPQIKTSEFDVNYASYWGMAVSRNTENYEIAWQFIRWLTQTENAKKYLELAGQPAARRDLITWQENDPDLGVFAKQSLTAFSWYQPNNTLVEKHFAEMIESVVRGEMTISDALDKAADEITILMKDY